MLQVEGTRSLRVAIKRRTKCLGVGNRSFSARSRPITCSCDRILQPIVLDSIVSWPVATPSSNLLWCGIPVSFNSRQLAKMPKECQESSKAAASFCSAQTRLFGRLSARPGKFRFYVWSSGPTKTPAKHPEVPFAFGSMDRGPLMEKAFARSTLNLGIHQHFIQSLHRSS